MSNHIEVKPGYCYIIYPKDSNLKRRYHVRAIIDNERIVVCWYQRVYGWRYKVIKVSCLELLYAKGELKAIGNSLYLVKLPMVQIRKSVFLYKTWFEG